MATNAILVRPGAGQRIHLPVGPAARLEFAFDQDNANVSKDGQDLILSFDDGGVLILEGFYAHFGDGAAYPPTLIVEGNELPGEQFLAAFNNPDLMPAAGPALLLRGGHYEEVELPGVASVEHLEKLLFDGWGHAAENTAYSGGETDEADEAAPELPGGTFGLTGNSYDMNGIFVNSGMYEDWRPNQHEGDYHTILPGRLDFAFTPTGTTVVDAIHLSGFHTDSIIVIGTPQFDAEGNITNGMLVTGPGQVFTFSQANFDNSGVYVLPPKNSDKDMLITVTLDLRAESSGISGQMNGSFTIIVDAVADKPEVQAAAFDSMSLVGSVDEAREISKEFDGKGWHIVTQKMDGTEEVSVAVPFTTTIRFDDYEDGSEKYYALIEIPSVPPGAAWNCPEAMDMITGPDGKEYFRIPVDNAEIARAGGEITVKVTLTVTGSSAIVKDAGMHLKVGAMAEEHPDDGELRLDNNIAFDWKEGGAELKLDVVDGGLVITAGWASEGSNDSKHIGGEHGSYQASDFKEAGATGSSGGAPIRIEAGVDSKGQPECITSVSFSYDASEGHIWHFNGSQWVDLDPSGSGKVTIEGLSTGRLDGLEYRPQAGSFSDADVEIRYTVQVQNEAGVKGSYSGSFTVVVDAVADMPVGTGADGLCYSYKGETEGLSAATEGTIISFTVQASFPDIHGSEEHFLLVQLPPRGSQLFLCDKDGNDISGKYGTITIGNESFYKIPAGSTEPSASAQVYFKVDEKRGDSKDGSYEIKTGALAVVRDERDDGGFIDREYDPGNNQACVINPPVTIVVDYLDAGGVGKVVGMYEDNMPDKHLGVTTQGSAKDGTLTFNIGYAGGAKDINTIMTGEADGNIHITFSYEGTVDTLRFTMNGQDYNAERTPGTNDFLLKIPAADLGNPKVGTDGALKYHPPIHDDHDLMDINFSTWVKNTATGETRHLENIKAGSLIVDAVADKPTGLVLPGADGLSYALGQGANGKPASQESAAWGSEIGFTLGVSFHDIADGSEKHYMLVEARPGWSGGYSTVIVNGVKYFVIDVNEAINEALNGDGKYERDGVRVEIVLDGKGQPQANVSVDVNLALPEKGSGSYAYMKQDGSVTLKAGGLAIEGEITFASGIATIRLFGSDQELRLDNNIALSLGEVKVAVNVVTSDPRISITDNDIYENLTANAHKGDETRSDGAKITVSNIHPGENAEIVFSFDFVKGGAKEGSFDSAPGIHADDVMRLEFTDNDGQTHSFPIAWDGGKWSCTVSVEGGNDALFVFKPGYNYNSTDIAISYEIAVTDPASGDTINWKSGDNPNVPGLTVIVDAVAQKPIIDTVDAEYDRMGGTDAFVSGGKVDLGIKLEFRDYEDGSERHYVLAEAKVGWEVPSSTLIIVDGKGVAHETPVIWEMQMINGKLYYKAEVDNKHIQEWGTQGEYGNGMLEMHVIMQSPPGVSGDMHFKVGGGAWEDKDMVDGEIRWDNNSAFAFGEVEISFSKAGDFGLIVGGWVYENDTPNAHLGDSSAAGGTTLTVTVSNKGDEITDFKFTNYDPSKGVLFLNLPDGSLVEINPDGSMPGNPALKGGEVFSFIPGHNYSDLDVKLNYTGTITDPRSGDSKDSSKSSLIVVDAVAQKPEYAALAEDGKEAAIDWHGGEDGKGIFSLNVAAKFEDFEDGSESHYVLVEALPNMSVPGSAGIFSIRNPDGSVSNYWKVPVNNDLIAKGGGTVTVNVTVVIEGVIPGHGINETMKVGALAVEDPSDGEITYHNNWAYTEGGSVHVVWGGGSGSGSGFYAEIAYENDRPNSHLGDETPAGGAGVSFGQTAEDSNIHVTWTGGEGYFKDSAGKEYRGGEANLHPKDGPFFFVPEGHGDDDVKVQYTLTDKDGNDRGGSGVIVVDAVANKPTGLDDQVLVDYGNNGKGHQYTAVGKPDGHGNDGELTIRISGNFVDNDGSEKHYALLEAQPGFNVPGGEMVYLDGKAYYRVEMDKDPATGEYLLDANGKQYADVVVQIANPAAIGKGGHDLGAGLMAEEQNTGSSGKLEGTLENNVSWTLGGNAHIEISFVNSSVSVKTPEGVYERSEGDPGFALTISGKLGEDDTFGGMTLSAKGKGEFSVDDPQGVGGWEIVDGKLLISDWNAIGKITVIFTPESHSDQDIEFSWKAHFINERSGDEEVRSGNPYVIVDAVANAPDIVDYSAVSDSGNQAVQAGEGAKISTTLSFEDMSGREIHYAVLEQGAYAGSQSNVWLCDKVSINGVEYPIITVFDQGGKPYYAVEVPHEALVAGKGTVDVVWHVTAPNATQDLEVTIKVGGISVEPNTGAGSNKELTLDNNWAESIQGVPVRIGVFDTKHVGFGKSGDIVEGDGTGVPIQLGAPDFGATNEIIIRTEFSFSQEGAREGDVIGTLWYDGKAHEIVVGADGKGHATMDFGPEGYDPNADFRFTATDKAGSSSYNSNPIIVDTISTVRDIYLNEERDFTDQQLFKVIAVADAPTKVEASVSADPASSGGTVIVTVSASFADVDGSEKHYVLVEALPGWVCPEAGGTWTNPVDGKVYFQVEVDGSLTDVSKEVSLIAPKNHVVGEYQQSLGVGGLAVEQAAGSRNDNGFASGGSVDVLIHDSAHFAMNINNATLASGETLSLDLRLLNAQGGDMSAAVPIMIAFMVSNDAIPQDFSVPAEFLGQEAHDAQGNTLVWSQNAQGEYILTAVLAPGNSLIHISFEVFHTQDRPGFIDHHQSLSLSLLGVSDKDGNALTGLDAKIHIGGEENPYLHPGDHCTFPIVDADYAQHAAPYGITHEESVGKEIVHYDPDTRYTGAEGEHGQGQIIIGTDGHDIIYATQGNDILVGGGGGDTFVWNKFNMGHDEYALDVIKDFSKGDILRFDDFFGDVHSEEAEAAFANLLKGGTWQTDGEKDGGTFNAADGSGASIQLSVAETVASLSVSYQHEGQQYMQIVELQGFGTNQFHYHENELDHAAVAQMLQEIIKVGGCT